MALINSYNGIIAGIGDKSINANVIPPELDATFRHFAAGKDCVLRGLKYNFDTHSLSSGYCLAQGYVGGISQPISDIVETYYVYGVFTVHHNKDITDSFKVEVYDGELIDPQQDNILSVAGEYYFLIHPTAENKEYPLRAEYSDKTNTVLAGGVLQNGVICETQPVNDNSKKTANTEYVHNQIAKEINADSYDGEFLSSTNSVYGHFRLIRKAKLVVGVAEINVETPNGNLSSVIARIPESYYPNKTVYFGVRAYIRNVISLYVLELNTVGEIRVKGGGAIVNEQYPNLMSFGYETN